MSSTTPARVRRPLRQHSACALCPRMLKPVVVGRPVASGDKEPKLGRRFAWTAGKTPFKWFYEALGWTEDETRDRIYFAAVCRCFPGKKETGGDRLAGAYESSGRDYAQEVGCGMV